MPVLLRLSEKVAHRLRKAEFAAKGVTLKLKTADFKTRTRARAMPPTQLALRIFEAGRELLLKEADGTRFRLIGIGASEIVAGDEADGATSSTPPPRAKSPASGPSTSSATSSAGKP